MICLSSRTSIQSKVFQSDQLHLGVVEDEVGQPGAVLRRPEGGTLGQDLLLVEPVRHPVVDVPPLAGGGEGCHQAGLHAGLVEDIVVLDEDDAAAWYKLSVLEVVLVSICSNSQFDNWKMSIKRGLVWRSISWDWRPVLQTDDGVESQRGVSEDRDGVVDNQEISLVLGHLPPLPVECSLENISVLETVRRIVDLFQ